MEFGMSRSSWRSLRQASENENRKINGNINESTENNFSLDQNFIKVLKSQKSGSTEEPLDEDLFVKTNLNQSNQLRERSRIERRVTPRSFESMRALKSSWTRWQTRQNSENSNDKPVKISSSETPIFEGFATSKPLWSASMKINQGKKLDYVETNSRMYPIVRIIKTIMPRTSKLEEMKFELNELHSGSDDTTRTEVKPAAETSDKLQVQNTQEAFSDGMKGSSRSACYRLPPRSILEWLKDNHRVQDLLKLLEKSEKGNFSYDEFVQEMKNMGAPGSQEELYDMACALDTDQDELINYQEVRKLKPRFRASSFVSNNEFLNQRNAILPELRPCSKCEIGLFEPTRMRIRRFICLRLKNYVMGRGTQKNTFIGQFTFDVEPDISIYGIQRMVKAELGGSAISVKILRRNQGVEILNHTKSLEDYGYTGSTDRDQPEMVELLYDYDYPRLDCPLLLANMSR